MGSFVTISYSILSTAEVRFIEKLATNLMAVEKHQVVLETIVENPHNRAVQWFKDGKAIKDARYIVKNGLVLDMVDRLVWEVLNARHYIFQ